MVACACVADAKIMACTICFTACAWKTAAKTGLDSFNWGSALFVYVCTADDQEAPA
jgi:hypothetical protein